MILFHIGSISMYTWEAPCQYFLMSLLISRKKKNKSQTLQDNTMARPFPHTNVAFLPRSVPLSTTQPNQDRPRHRPLYVIFSSLLGSLQTASMNSSQSITTINPHAGSFTKHPRDMATWKQHQLGKPVQA